MFNRFKFTKSSEIISRSVRAVDESSMLLTHFIFYRYWLVILFISTFVKWSSLKIEIVYFSCFKQLLMYSGIKRLTIKSCSDDLLIYLNSASTTFAGISNKTLSSINAFDYFIELTCLMITISSPNFRTKWFLKLCDTFLNKIG